ncbi:endonuclease/exonuclease/phosphatase family protein [Erythrobacter crassostreae]|uniref:Endonuclease/exonuclease/phosphatase family protein n=1 Tax=Erythrobacter crassostreae TaxID=2828328 RepID=A0A9X1F361_9SPHN|nr:endonuclease/exonuclease/phosphatase family protein [Erythrobacter crassostrea]MBV7259422.1 endonuclease/exonuclease/phosphatase family protein [Erythrobacter crassostrea]
MRAVSYTFLTIGIVAAAATSFSLVHTDWWFVRALDLVREPATYLFTALLIGSLLAKTWFRGWTALLLGFSAIINVWCIWPYSSLASTQIELAPDAPDNRCFTAYSANVKMENTNFSALIEQVDKYDPDILFLTETDEKWIEALSPMLSNYPTVQTHPQDDTFGKVFASRLQTVDVDFNEKEGEDTPTLFSLLRASDTALIRFTGLHPKAPLPGQNTEQRDRSIVRAAKIADGDIAGAIVMGDFNDVPWSRTTSEFRDKGEWSDPRIGRGTFPTFPSFALPIGWPLDQVMVKGDVAVRSLEVMDSNGSDHRALLAHFCLPRPINIQR